MKRHVLLLLSLSFMFILSGCYQIDSADAYLKRGVRRELAQFRKANYSDIRYDLFFRIPEKQTEAVEGIVEVSVELQKQKDIILDFRADIHQIKSIVMNGSTLEPLFANEHILIPDTLTRPGENKVYISFIPSDQSLNRRDEFLYTLLVPDRARTLFPCFDQPDMKASYTLSLEVPIDWEAVTNSAVDYERVELDGSRKMIYYKPTEPLSTYLFSFVAGELHHEHYTRGDREISIYHRQNDEKKLVQCPDIANEVFDALEWLENYTGIPYPFAKYDVIILPGFQYGGMEHTGATLYTDTRMFISEHPTLNERLNRSALIAHETAHMWFGDYVTMEWFDDVWTKEVFANYFASRIVAPLYPDINHELNFILDYLPGTYAEDRTSGSNPVKQTLDNLENAGLVYGSIIYNKSPVIMEMMVKVLGEEAFRQGIQEYLTTYAYGNADWKGLISILDQYTDTDLNAWSQAWIHEKGMPHISAEIKEDNLVISQKDPFERGLFWPQDVVYTLYGLSEPITLDVVLNGKNNPTVIPLEKTLVNGAIPLPNTNGTGYGFFAIHPKEVHTCYALLDTSSNEVMKGSLLITLYENVWNGTISPDLFISQTLSYAAKEEHPLLFSTALSYINQCLRFFPATTDPENALWDMVTQSADPSFRLQAFRLYSSIASSAEAINRLTAIWKNEDAPEKCHLSENDYINLAYTLSLRTPEQYQQIMEVQLERIAHPDRRKEFLFISPALSPSKAVRDSVFNSLLNGENRRIEPWAATALGYINHHLRQEEGIQYIRPALDILTEVQRTGDIFFPTAWIRSLLAGHQSEMAKKEVESFLHENPQLHPMLKQKILQQAHPLFINY